MNQASVYCMTWVLLALLSIRCSEEPIVPPPPNDLLVTLVGTVRDSEFLLAVEGAIVEAKTSNSVDTSDAFGGFVLQDVKFGDETLAVSRPGYESTRLHITVKEHNDPLLILMGGSERQLLFVGSQDGHDIFIIDVDNLTCIDSLHIADAAINSLYATPGGTKLYILPSNGSSMFALDPITHALTATSIPICAMHFAPWIGVIGFGDGIFAIDTTSNTAIQLDTTSLYSPQLHPTMPYIYAFRSHPPRSRLYVYDWNAQRFSDSLDLSSPGGISLNPVATAISSDGTKWFCISDNGYFGAVDFTTRIVSANARVNHLGSLGIAPNGAFILVTDPGGYVFQPTPSGLITIIRTQDGHVDGYIDINSIRKESNLTDRIVISRRGRYAFASDWLSGVFVVDITARKGIKKFIFSSDGQIIPLALVAKQ